MADDVVIVGVGALGSHVALFGRAWGRPLRLVDFDRVEAKNTLAQMYSKLAIGKNKAVALQQFLAGGFGQRVQALPHKLVVENADAVLGQAALVIDCTDNAAARGVIHAWVSRNGTPCLHGALSAEGTFARVVWDEHFAADAEPAEAAVTCEDGRHLPFFALAAAELAIIVQQYFERGKRTSVQLTRTGITRLT